MGTVRTLLSSISNDKPRSRRNLFLKLAISLGLILIIYGTTNLETLFQTLSTVSLRTALALLALYTLGQLISAIKWRVFIAEIGLKRSVAQVERSYFAGMFVNTFGLGTVGGDVARGLLLYPSRGKRAAALATVVADRVHGLAVLALIGAVSILLVRPQVLGPLAVWGGALVVVLAALGWWLGPLILTKLFPAEHRFGHAAREVSHAFPKSLTPILIVTAISLFFHSLQIYMHYIIAHELNTALTLSYLFAVIPLVNIASALPLSVNGLGVREAMYMFLLIPVGVPKETAVAFGAIWIVCVTLVSAVGGFVAAYAANKPPLAEQIEVEEEIDKPRRAQSA